MKTAQPEVTLSPADMSSVLALEMTGFPQRERWSEHSWQAELQLPSRCGFAVREGRVVVAVCLLSVVLGEAELLRIVVDPARRGRGLARRLLDEGIRWARSRGAVRMLLEVREDNGSARRLYASAGFAQIHRRENYYGPDKDALVLARTLAPGAPFGTVPPGTAEEEIHD